MLCLDGWLIGLNVGRSLLISIDCEYPPLIESNFTLFFTSSLPLQYCPVLLNRESELMTEVGELRNLTAKELVSTIARARDEQWSDFVLLGKGITWPDPDPKTWDPDLRGRRVHCLVEPVHNLVEKLVRFSYSDG